MATALEIVRPVSLPVPSVWDIHRAEREAAIRSRIAAYEEHEKACEQRAFEYLAKAAKFPAAHKDHHYYTRLASDQLALAANARRRANVERASL